jgi:hypothetical protein
LEKTEKEMQSGSSSGKSRVVTLVSRKTAKLLLKAFQDCSTASCSVVPGSALQRSSDPAAEKKKNPGEVVAKPAHWVEMYHGRLQSGWLSK